MKFAIGSMTVGDILDRGLKILWSRLPTFYALYLIALLPAILFQLFAVGLAAAGSNGAPSDAAVGGLLGGTLVLLIALLILTPIATAAVLHVIGQEFVDRRATLGEAFGVALSRFGPLLGTSILFGLLYILGFLACIIPGILIAVWYAVFAQVVVMEKKSGMAALNRSKDLVTGFGWRVFGVMILIGIITSVAQMAVTIPLNSFLPAMEAVPGPGGVVQQKLVSLPNYIIQQVASFLVTVLGQSYQAICMTLIYFDLRIRKEGFDLELAALQHKNEEGMPGGDEDFRPTKKDEGIRPAGEWPAPPAPGDGIRPADEEPGAP
jgi:hypothetical protein